MSDRFFFDGPLSPGPFELDGPEAHHLAHVRRLAAGGRVALFNGDGHEYPATIREVGKKRVTLDIHTVESPQRELPFRLHIASALPKGDRADFLIEKLTELGVTDFTPLMTERSIVKADDAKCEKFRRAVIEASKQCGRTVLMRIHSPARFADWQARQTGQRWIAHPGPEQTAMIANEDAVIAIGPEGGFSDGEALTAIANGWKALNLGPRILRIETAAIAAAIRFAG